MTTSAVTTTTPANNEIATPLQNLSSAQLLAALRKAKATSPVNQTKYMKFNGKTGRFSIEDSNEPDGKTIESGSEFYLNLMGAQHGYQCWKENKVVDRHMSSVFVGLPHKDSLNDHGPYAQDDDNKEGWGAQFVFQLKEKATGQQFSLTLSSVGGQRAANDFLEEVINKSVLEGDHIMNSTPLVKIKSVSFKTTQGKKSVTNYKPAFEVINWVNPDMTTAPKKIETVAPPKK
jgi:hypothetical protein